MVLEKRILKAFPIYGRGGHNGEEIRTALGQLVLEKRILKAFPIYGRGGHNGKEIRTALGQFSFPPPTEALIQNLDTICQMAFLGHGQNCQNMSPGSELKE